MGGGVHRAVGAYLGLESCGTARVQPPREFSRGRRNTHGGQNVGDRGGSKEGKAGLGGRGWCGGRQAAAKGEHGALAGGGPSCYVTGTTIIPIRGPRPRSPRPRDRSWSQLRPFLRAPNTESLSLEPGATAFPSGSRGTLRGPWSEPGWSGPLTKESII